MEIRGDFDQSYQNLTNRTKQYTFSFVSCQRGKYLYPLANCPMVQFVNPMVKTTSFTSWLQGELKTRDWTISQFARRSRISDAHLSRLLAGTRKPGVEALSAIAQALDLPLTVVYRYAGLLPIANGDQSNLEQEWLHIFRKATDSKQKEELLAYARFTLQQMQTRTTGPEK